MSPKQDEDSDSVTSDFSDTDYELEKDKIEHLVQWGVSAERCQELWNKQSGLCHVTNFALVFSNDVLYSVEVAPRRVNEPISDTNSILVCKGVALMRESLNVSWTQFKSFIFQCTQNLD